ncbi:uncharacterized protein [Battus philenor]|uniref:uncharacterized protein n=1 Tax=Battus philenor TaxID=42288 RepID=UPI0035CFECE3
MCALAGGVGRDLTWATPAAMRMLSAWRVAEEVVTLSDYRHIVFHVAIRRPDADSGGCDGSTTRRWCLKQLEAAACVANWPNAEEVLSETESKFATCRCPGPVVPSAGRCTGGWRKLRNYRRSACRAAAASTPEPEGAPEEEMSRLYREYRSATKALQKAIASAKAGKTPALDAPDDGDLRTGLSEESSRYSLSRRSVKSLRTPPGIAVGVDG